MVRNRRTLLLLYVLFGLLISCGNNQGIQNYPATGDFNTTEISVTDTPNQASIINSYTDSPQERAFQLSGFPEGYISHIFWSKDTDIIFFWVNTELWAYELSTEDVQKMNPSHVWMKVYPTQSPTPFPEISLNDLPGITEIVTMSPSGEKALVFNSDTPNLTPAPDGDGIIGKTDVWLWDHGNSYKLGTVDICGTNIYNWTNDESYVSIQPPLAPAPCSSNGWVVNIQAQNIHDVLPINVYGGVSEFGDYSIAQDYILLIHRNRDDDGAFVRLHHMNLESLKMITLDVPRITYPVGWINSEQLLVSYAEQLGDIQVPGVFNIQTGTLENLTIPPSLQNLRIDPISLSPDKKWVAFAAQEIPLEKSSLWLMPLQN